MAPGVFAFMNSMKGISRYFMSYASVGQGVLNFHISTSHSLIVNIEIFGGSQEVFDKKIIYKKSEFDISLTKGRC